MKNPRRTLFYFFLVYNIILFLGALYMDSKQDDLGFLLNVKYYIPWMKYFTFFGLVLFFIAYVVVTRDVRLTSKDLNKSKEEHMHLKAKLFDLQEESRSNKEENKSIQPPIENPPISNSDQKDEDSGKGGDQ